jgi:hypothetical protein
MALSTATGTFTLRSGNGTQEVNFSSAFQPKVILVWWSRATADVTFVANGGYGFGVAVDRVSDQQMNIAGYNADNVGTTASAYSKRTALFMRVMKDDAANTCCDVSITSFDADGGFTITTANNDDTCLAVAHYLALGGSDITNAFLGEFAMTTGTGAQAFTGVGFQGNLGIFFQQLHAGAGNADGNRYYGGLGFANATQQAGLAFWGHHGTTAPNASESYMDASNAILSGNIGTGGIFMRASLTTFDADGFTINRAASMGVTRQFFGLIIQGNFQSHIATQARKITTTGTVDYTTGFQPGAVLLAGAFPTADATETIQSHWSIGAGTSSSDDHGIWVGDASTINTDTNNYSDAGNIYTQATNPSTIAAQANLDSMQATAYRLNWSTVDANARLFMHLALASNSTTPPMFRGS